MWNDDLLTFLYRVELDKLLEINARVTSDFVTVNVKYVTN